MYCRKCGKEIPDDSVFCPKCGVSVEEIKADSADNATDSDKADNSKQKQAEVLHVDIKQKKRRSWIWILPAVLLIAVVVLFITGIISFDPASASEESPGAQEWVTDLLSKESKKVSFLDDTDAINERAASVVMLNCFDKAGNLIATGSGFAAFEDGVIVTNFHVIENRVYSVTGELETGMSFPVDRVIAYSEEYDIAILKTDVKTGMALLSFGNSLEAAKGDKVIAVGYPKGLGNTVSSGIISSIYGSGNDRMIQFTAPISNGSSGGALINDSGDVIGVTFASYESGQNLNYAVPIEFVEQVWNMRDQARPLSFSDIASAGVLTVSDLAADPAAYEGQEIIVEGYIDSIFKKSVILVEFDKNRSKYINNKLDNTYSKDAQSKGFYGPNITNQTNLLRSLSGIEVIISAGKNNRGFDGQYRISGILYIKRDNSGNITSMRLTDAALSE